MQIRLAIRSQHQVEREQFPLLAHNMTRNLCKNAFKNPKFKLHCVQQFFESVFCVYGFSKSCLELFAVTKIQLTSYIKIAVKE